MKHVTLPQLTGRHLVRGLILALLVVMPAFGQAAVEFDVLWEEDGLCIEDYPVRAMVAWRTDLDDIAGVEVRVGAPDGNLFTAAGRTGSDPTGPWVTEAMEFFLISRPGGEILAQASLDTPSCESLRLAERRRRLSELLERSPEKVLRFELSPPRLFYCGQPVERTAVRLEWDVSALEASRVEIFLRSVDGPLFARGSAVGQAETRDWVIDGTVFVLYLPEFEQVAATREFRIRPCAEARQ